MGSQDDGSDVDADAGESAFTDALAALDDEARNLLVVGAVPRKATVAASRHLFGEPSPDRWKLLVYTHNGPLDAGERLAAGPGGPTPGRVEVVRLVLPTRGAAAASDPHPVETRVESDRLSELGRTVSDRILEQTRSGNDRSTPEIRVCFDSLSSLLAEYDTEPVFRFVNMMTGQIRNVGGMSQFHLPQPRDSETASLLAPLFDAVVELRVADGDVQHRWHIADGNVSSDWQPLENTERRPDG